MKQHAVVIACASLLVANAAIAANRCDMVLDTPQLQTRTEPAKVYAAQCNATGIPGLPTAVRSGTGINTPLGSGVLEFVDQWQGVCEFKINGRGTGQFKADTTCGAGATKIAQNGVWMCSEPARTVTETVMGSNQRDQCRRDLRVRVDSVNGYTLGPRPAGARPWQIMASPPNAQGREFITLYGMDVAAAESVTLVSRGNQNPERRELTLPARLAPPVLDRCIPPNCQSVEITMPAATPLGFYTVTLTPRAPSQPGSANIEVVPYVPPATSFGGGRTGTTPSTGVANQTAPQPAAPAAQRAGASSSKICGSSNSQLPVWNRTQAGVFTTSANQTINVNIEYRRDSPCWCGGRECPTAEFLQSPSQARSWTLRQLDPRSSSPSMSITWRPGASTVALPIGRWEIDLSDASIPPGVFHLTYTP